jgi:hypothetical protein
VSRTVVLTTRVGASTNLLAMPCTPRLRPDGWPYCPRCGADELYCLRDDLVATGLRTDDDLGCYLCGHHWVAIVTV